MSLLAVSKTSVLPGSALPGSILVPLNCEPKSQSRSLIECVFLFQSLTGVFCQCPKIRRGGLLRQPSKLLKQKWCEFMLPRCLYLTRTLSPVAVIHVDRFSPSTSVAELA